MNGNILNLSRNGKKADNTFDIIDGLGYTYNGNQLLSVNDSGSPIDGFRDGGSTSGTEYTYDANGNMISDNNKNITNINYNTLNLPNSIQIATGATNLLNYIYDAAGIKLRKQVSGTTTDYIGTFIYEDNDLKYILTSNGRIVVDTSTYSYQYFIKDHLGNTRATIDATGKVLQEDSYYAFGMAMNGLSFTDNSLLANDTKNKYLYNGKELQDELGLELYDFGARFMDPVLGRFFTQDRFAEKYFDLSPYQYCANNPIKFIDINGDSLKLTAAFLKDKTASSALIAILKSEAGKAYFAKYAAKGILKIGKESFEFKENGVYSSKGIDLELNAGITDYGGPGETGIKPSKDGGFDINVDLDTRDQSVFDAAETMTHEVFLESEYRAKDVFTDRKIDWSNAKEAKTWKGMSGAHIAHAQNYIDRTKKGDVNMVWPGTAYKVLQDVNKRLNTGFTNAQIQQKMSDFSGFYGKLKL